MLPRLLDIEQIAGRFGIAFVARLEEFDLDIEEPFALHQTYNRNQAGITVAFVDLARYEERSTR